MEHVVMMVVLAMLNLCPASAASLVMDNLTATTTVDDIFFQRYHMHLQDLRSDFLNTSVRSPPTFGGASGPQFTLTSEVVNFTAHLVYTTVYELTEDLKKVTEKFLIDDLNNNCYEYLENSLVGLRDNLTNTSCVETRLRDMVTSMVKRAIEVSLQKVSRDSVQQFPTLLSTTNHDCTRDYESRVRYLTRNFFQDLDVLDNGGNRILVTYVDDINSYFKNVEPLSGKTPLDVITLLLVDNVNLLNVMNTNFDLFNIFVSFISTNVVEPLTFENVVNPWANVAINTLPGKHTPDIISQNDMTWGIIRTTTGSVDLPCSFYRFSGKYYTRDFLRECYTEKSFQSNSKLLLCAYSEPSESPLTWSTATSLFFHSACLCVATNGTDCSVKAPLGVDLRFYCLSVLLRDFQRQVTYRPAITYFDYAFQTRVPVCNIANFLSSTYRRDCTNIPGQEINLRHMTHTLCFFKGLVNKNLNCSEALIIGSYNLSQLCEAIFIMSLVYCDDKSKYDIDVTYYSAGNSLLVLVLTYVDIAVRILTLVTYLTCPELRNLPGKLLICYMMTSLLKLLVVLPNLEDMSLTVRLDVAMDLASTLWLTSYLHFLTSSIKILRPPDSLSPAEARMVILRYALLGWALPAVLSAVFFWMDEAQNSHVQVGQILFVLCNYAALCSNLYMFYRNCSFYFDVRKGVQDSLRGLTRRKILADLFNFALKTSVLTGAGITIRLIFTQIQGLEFVLGYYHALGTLHGLLLFLLYGCNVEARDFWIILFRSTLRRCRNCQKNCRRRNSLQLAEYPDP